VRVRDPFLRATFWVFAVYASVFVYFGTARYLLPALPPFLWLLVRGEALVANPSRARLLGSVAGSAILALLVLRADAGFAGAWREAARQLPPAGRGFHTGRWGFFAYAAERGYRPLPPRERLRDGDVIAEPRASTPSPVPAQAVLLVPRSVLHVPSPDLRVLDGTVGAGLYSSFWGVLPLGWRRGAFEEVALSAPDAEILSAVAQPVTDPVVLDMGSEQARHAELDGWSEPEAFTDGDGLRRTFVWGVGPESAVRVPLPAGLRHVRLRLSPAPAAVGPLRVQVGPDARGQVDLAPGWRTYELDLSGSVAGGLTDVVLVPSGYESPGALTAERRELSVALDAIGFGSDEGTENRGCWPVRGEDGRPRLFRSIPAPPPPAH
jgi:hypothetical protein